MNLRTGMIIYCFKAIVIPINQEVIDRVEALSKKYGIIPALKLNIIEKAQFTRTMI